jgi:hypothetical protein
MKVNISYSVAIEEVLPLVEKLYTESNQQFKKSYVEANTMLEASFTDDALQAMLSQITKLRQEMVEFDSKLGELLGMAKGYQHILNGAPTSHELELPAAFPEEGINDTA